MSTSWYPLNKPSTGRASFALEDQNWSQRYNPKADLPPNFLTLPHRQAGSLLICRCTLGPTLLPPCLPRHDTVPSRPRHPGRWPLALRHRPTLHSRPAPVYMLETSIVPDLDLQTHHTGIRSLASSCMPYSARRRRFQHSLPPCV